MKPQSRLYINARVIRKRVIFIKLRKILCNGLPTSGYFGGTKTLRGQSNVLLISLFHFTLHFCGVFFWMNVCRLMRTILKSVSVGILFDHLREFLGLKSAGILKRRIIFFFWIIDISAEFIIYISNEHWSRLPRIFKFQH